MCEIFFLKSTNGEGLPAEMIEELLKSADLSSGRNSDGFGLFNEDREIYKSEEKFDVTEHGSDIIDKYEGSEFLVLHLRMATNGAVCKENAHPFKDGDDLLVHNGVVRTDVVDHSSKPDSYEFLLETRLYKKGDDAETPEAIENTLSDATGSVSIFYYDHNDDLYYFRDRKPFHFGMDLETETLIGASKEKRLKSLLKGRRKKFDFFDIKQEPEGGKIFQITNSGISQVGKFDTRRYGGGRSSSVYGGYSYNTSKKKSRKKKSKKKRKGDDDSPEKPSYKSEPMTYEEYIQQKQEDWRKEEDEKQQSLKPEKPFQDEEGNYMEVNF